MGIRIYCRIFTSKQVIETAEVEKKGAGKDV